MIYLLLVFSRPPSRVSSLAVTRPDLQTLWGAKQCCLKQNFLLCISSRIGIVAKRPWKVRCKAPLELQRTLCGCSLHGRAPWTDMLGEGEMHLSGFQNTVLWKQKTYSGLGGGQLRMDQVVLECRELSTVQLWKQQCWAPAQLGRCLHLLSLLQFVLNDTNSNQLRKHPRPFCRITFISNLTRLPYILKSSLFFVSAKVCRD